MNILSQVNKSWTLFLDRDGVINHERQNAYILKWEEFRFYDGVTDALKIPSDAFGTVVIVTNQRGVGKELMTVDELDIIHSNMLAGITAGNGRIDKIYYCSSLDDNCSERKPNPGMAYLAKADFPRIDYSKSIMVGNKPGDMKFGRNAGMYTIFIATTDPQTPFPHPDVDLRFNSLPGLAKALSAALTES